ncbi:glycosyltransferase family 1 protein [Thiomicrorhabdus sp.]|uniref:glycosyltransferase family 4 protein n=1 Tax=Thiomicrorhabdus sp. TaxID=2039724 RepID=UPI0029C8BBED|nr:glycosyltransferase family 1 protein [Thiomicrorhabdus sp.]
MSKVIVVEKASSMNTTRSSQVKSNLPETVRTGDDRAIRRLTLVSDAWQPQVNGVVTTLNHLVKELTAQGVEVDVIQPQPYPCFPLPTYPEIRLVRRAPDLEERLLDFQPDAIHIATEGTLGWAVRKLALKHGLPFTTGYHTKYPEYIHKRFPWIPESWVYRFLRRFHQPAQCTLVPGESILQELQEKGFHDLRLMSRGVDTDLFNPERRTDLGLPRPVMLYVGRVAPEKNLRAFLDLELPGTKLIVGKGPDLDVLQNAYPEVKFVGAKRGEELAKYYASADVFVFPSKTDTFGVVNLEAIASGTPVAAFPVTGPKDILKEGVNGCLSENLDEAISAALQLDRKPIAASIPEFRWPHAAKQFLQNLAPIKQTT